MNNHQPFSTVGEQGFLSVLSYILDRGYKVDKERTGTGTIVSPTPHQLFFPNVGEKFPLFTTKEVSFNMLASEMLWFISGSTNTNDLEKIGSPAMKKMWDKWSDEDGELGPVYGKQWRAWADKNSEHFRNEEEANLEYREIDQLQNAIDMIKENPTSRRIRVSAWNPADIVDMALPPCHFDYQFTCEPLSTDDRFKTIDELDFPDKIDETNKEYLERHNAPKYRLHLHMTQRSCDMFLGEN